MADYGDIWAEEDGPGFVPAKLQSYVPPENGRIYVMYHGTRASDVNSILKNGFQRSKDGMLGPGVYISRDIRKASRYPLGLRDSQKAVLKLRVNVGKVIKINYQGHPLQKTWRSHGIDTAWCPPNCGMVPSGLEEDCVSNPNRIKVVDVLRPKACGDPWAYPDEY